MTVTLARVTDELAARVAADFPFRDGEVRAVEVGPNQWNVVVEPCGGNPVRYRLVGPDAGPLARALEALPGLLRAVRAGSEAELVTAPPWQQADWLPPQVREIEEILAGVAG